MAEQEKIQYAKAFIDKLANGIHPLDDTPIPEGDVLNNVHLVRDLFMVSELLREMLQMPSQRTPKESKSAKQASKPRKEAFHLTPEEAAQYECTEHPISVTEFAYRLNMLARRPDMRKLSYRNIMSWLYRINMLCERENDQGVIKKYPTAAGCDIGISCEMRFSSRGAYEVVLYNATAQQFVLDHMDAVTDYKPAEPSSEDEADPA